MVMNAQFCTHLLANNTLSRHSDVNTSCCQRYIGFEKVHKKRGRALKEIKIHLCSFRLTVHVHPSKRSFGLPLRLRPYLAVTRVDCFCDCRERQMFASTTTDLQLDRRSPIKNAAIRTTKTKTYVFLPNLSDIVRSYGMACSMYTSYGLEVSRVALTKLYDRLLCKLAH